MLPDSAKEGILFVKDTGSHVIKLSSLSIFAFAGITVTRGENMKLSPG
jgi:hypothetical protein